MTVRTRVCDACGHSNPPRSRFCGGCGRPLGGEARCGSCGATNPVGHRFCNACGGPLQGSPTERPTTAHPRGPEIPEHLAAKIRTGRSALEGERKQVTVLFADLVASMELAEQTDVEVWQTIMDRLFALLGESVHRFEGTVDKFTGDGVMALFGAPIAHEDHARRACYAALEMQARFAAQAAELRRSEGLSIAIRIGVNSGEVVVGAIGDDLGMDYTAVGHTVGLAQRMEALAEPGKAYLTGATARLVDGYLSLRDLGEFNVKGASQPLRVYELTGPGRARGRLDVSRSRGLSRFVGRDEEMELLGRALRDAEAGKASVIGVVGEAGVGKSRLCREFVQRCRGNGVPVYEAAAQPHTRSVALLPVLQLLRAYFGISDHDSERTARERIAGRLLLLDEGFADDLPLIFDFLAVPDPERRPPRMDPEARKRQLLALARRLLRAQSAREPGVTLFEDLHWIDAASEEFLANHVDAIGGTRSLTIVNFRPEYQAAWMSRAHYRQIGLVPLGPEATEELLANLLGSDPSLIGVPRLIHERTRGNPFFVEELVQSLAEAGDLVGEPGSYRLARPIGTSAVPPSVEAVLAARIDRLSAADKAVLQHAAVIGKEHRESVLARVVDIERAELEASIRRLVAADFVVEQEVYPETVLAFKHPLTQEVAYRSQLGSRRAAIHAAVAEAIAEQDPDRLDERAALLAAHWEAAGDALQAARWHARAGAWFGIHQPAAAFEHWQRVRELVDELPESDETAALGLTARIFSLQFGWRLGTSHADAEALFREGEEIAGRSGDLRSRATLLAVYGAIRGLSDGDARAMSELCGRAIALAEESGDRDLYLITAMGSYAYFVTGEIDEGMRVLERGIELADGDPTVGAGIAITCPLAYCVGFKGGFLVLRGELDRGRELIERGAELARRQDDIETVGWTHMWSVYHAYVSGLPEVALGHAQQAVEIAERLGDSFSRAWAWHWLGVARLQNGEHDAANDALERSRMLALERRTAVESLPYTLSFLAQARAELGDARIATELIGEALRLARTRGQRPAEAFACAAAARVLVAGGGSASQAEFERFFERGIELARELGMRPLEPMLRVERAAFARALGDEGGHGRELREAHRAFGEVGAIGRLEQLADEFAAAAR